MAKNKKVRVLTDLDLEEVSLVGKAANQRKFLFVKDAGGDVAFQVSKEKKLKIEVDSDGTANGTTVKINDEDLGKLTAFNFDLWKSLDSKDKVNIHCSYTKVVESEGGFERSETFRLSKGDHTVDEKIAKMLAEYYGTEQELISKADGDSVTAVVTALETINKHYKGTFPEDLGKAVGVLGEFAGLGCTVVVDKSAEIEELKKSFAAIVTQVKELKPVKKEETENDDSKFETLAKSIEAIQKQLEKNKSEAKEDPLETIAKSIGELGERMKVLEKSTDGASSLNSEEAEETAGVKKSGAKWPSLLEQA